MPGADHSMVGGAPGAGRDPGIDGADGIDGIDGADGMDDVSPGVGQDGVSPGGLSPPAGVGKVGGWSDIGVFPSRTQQYSSRSTLPAGVFDRYYPGLCQCPRNHQAHSTLQEPAFLRFRNRCKRPYRLRHGASVFSQR